MGDGRSPEPDLPGAIRAFRADLHLHTVLSPCAEVEMIPPFIVERAAEQSLDVIAITDHNSAENVLAVMRAARGTNLTVIPGMEVETKEEVHLVCLFNHLEDVLAWQVKVYRSLPPLKNREDVFGAQFVVDSAGDFVAYNERLLLTSTSLSVAEVAAGVRKLGGTCFPAHVDRPSYSLLGNLGFLPPEAGFRAVEISRNIGPQEACRRFPELLHCSLTASGDAHRLSEIDCRMILNVAEPTVTELDLAFARQSGRNVELLAE